MSKRRVIEDSDDDESDDNIITSVGDEKEGIVLSAKSDGGDEDEERDRTVDSSVEVVYDSWLEKRDVKKMSDYDKQKNIDLAKKQASVLKKRRVGDGDHGNASTGNALIKSRHTMRIDDSPNSTASPLLDASVQDYDLSMSLLHDTPDNKSRKKIESSMSRLMKNKDTSTSERSRRVLLREKVNADSVIVEGKTNKKKKKRRNDFDDDGDNYIHLEMSDDDDDDENKEEERKRQVLELKSREVVHRCTSLSSTLRSALSSWQSADNDVGTQDDMSCVNLCTINIKENGRISNGEEGANLLQQSDIQKICPNLLLKDYQLVGLNWLKLLHQNDVNGVLADDMGLGKTVQTISFLAWLFSCRENPERLRKQVCRAHEKMENVQVSDSENSDTEVVAETPFSPPCKANPDILPHLIVVPASTLANWCKEFEKFCPTLKVMRFHGSPLDKEEMKQRLRRAFLPKYQPIGGIMEDERVDVVITTYTMFERDSGAEDRSFLKKIPFEYLILDEAHCIKNSMSSRYQNLRGFNPRHRLLLSGTPVQNDVRELLALLSFLMPKIFRMEYIDFLYDSFMDRFIDMRKEASPHACHKGESKIVVDSVASNENANKISQHSSSLQELRCMLAPFVLRRLKSDVLQQLPLKKDVAVKLKMTDKQSSLYENIISTHLLRKTKLGVSTNSSDFNPMMKLTTSEASHIFTDLRKASNHPLLLRNHFTSHKVLNHIATVCFSMEHFGNQCDQKRVYQELEKLSDFDLNYLCLEYASQLSSYQLSNAVLYESPKFVYLKEHLPSLIAAGHRILIFSQWTKMMDILGAFLGDMRYSFLRLDGSTPVVERQRLIDEFERNVDIPIFILSTRAGGLGINLTAADTVILHDLDFNPENDRQAEDRCHRIGQEKVVTTYRLITQGSVDENIFDMGERKKRLSKAVLENEEQKKTGDKSVDNLEINNMLRQALLNVLKKNEAVDLTD